MTKKAGIKKLDIKKLDFKKREIKKPDIQKHDFKSPSRNMTSLQRLRDANNNAFQNHEMPTLVPFQITGTLK